jgi:hypothetical protein
MALRAVARLAVDRGGGSIDTDFEAQIPVFDASVATNEPREEAFPLALQIFDCFEQVAARHQAIISTA